MIRLLETLDRLSANSLQPIRIADSQFPEIHSPTRRPMVKHLETPRNRLAALAFSHFTATSSNQPSPSS